MPGRGRAAALYGSVMAPFGPRLPNKLCDAPEPPERRWCILPEVGRKLGELNGVLTEFLGNSLWKFLRGLLKNVLTNNMMENSAPEIFPGDFF